MDNKNNTGDLNAGSWNTGDLNTGDNNAGHWNTGDRNTGDLNTGNRNAGSWNAGNRNTGDLNTGHLNAGDRNAGSWNAGNRNTGDNNAGSWNAGNWNTGFFNTITPKNIMIFNKDYDKQEWDNHIKPSWIYFNLLIDELEWVNISDMSEQQKVDNPSYHVTNGFLLLKKSDYTKDEVYKKSAQKAWQDASHEDKMLTYQLPNFDADIAQEIFGIDFKAYLTQQNNDIIEVNGVKYKKI